MEDCSAEKLVFSQVIHFDFAPKKWKLTISISVDGPTTKRKHWMKTNISSFHNISQKKGKFEEKKSERPVDALAVKTSLTD